MKNSVKNILLIVFVSIVSTLGYQYYQNYSEARLFNNFLESAALVSSLHLEASEDFKNILDFSEISREEFENKISKVVSNSKEAYEIINNTDSSLTLKEKELLSLATSYWLQGLEMFEVSIITLIDNPNSEKIQDSIAQSISDLSIGDRSYSEFLFLIKQNATSEGTFLPILYEVEYVGLEDNSFRFADLLVDKAKSSTGGLFLRRNLSISGAEFNPIPIATTEEDYSVLLNDKIELQIVLTNEGNVDVFDVVILILVTDEYGETVHEQQSKIDTIGPQESRIFYSDAINIETGVLHEWFIKLEEVEKEDNLNDNLYSIFGFIPPEG
jgi:hypothetical protein|tara:strand:- start:531 stop:1511 length:981 start_codon:yes stop_codon:yes gene_type:complete